MSEASTEATRAYVGMGSNLGDRAGNLLMGVRGLLAADISVARLSSIYETEPVGVEVEQPAYLNLVAEIVAPPPSPEQLLTLLLEIERDLGRTRERPKAARTLDLDLLLYGAERRETELLTLPHPRLHLRRFVLVPLAELAPDAAHPTLRRTFRQLLDGLTEASGVRLWRPSSRQIIISHIY
ncbi:MAG TPA: 2-amino-4-hydroxy-6-hydroxymethyldihydropteridine diphosphokinase [Pyrinomonadaceae bacterium]|nr:2-amino-4-hydroxy-6-hydroxymethyldihydropteridine diphosphokinase [Pyrinomonadaceae bacterium]